MRWIVGLAVAAAVSGAGAGVAGATVCTNTCDHDYGVCNGLNGGNAQGVCMPKWFQCKKTCTSPARSPTKVLNVTGPNKPR